MAEAERFVFSYREITELLLKQQGIHEGIWMIYLEFGIQGTNVGATKDEVHPAAIVPVTKLGIQRIRKDSPMADSSIAVDAAVVNPLL